MLVPRRPRNNGALKWLVAFAFAGLLVNVIFIISEMMGTTMGYASFDVDINDVLEFLAPDAVTVQQRSEAGKFRSVQE
jgi:hypothetical protein